MTLSSFNVGIQIQQTFMMAGSECSSSQSRPDSSGWSVKQFSQDDLVLVNDHNYLFLALQVCKSVYSPTDDANFQIMRYRKKGFVAIKNKDTKKQCGEAPCHNRNHA